MKLDWQGRRIAHSDHTADLDRNAALYEFVHKMPRHEAEEKAYQEYKKDQHAKAGAFHLNGLRLAQSTGNMDESRKHHAMYKLHLKMLGHDIWGSVPDSIKQYLGKPEIERTWQFKPHHGDVFVLSKSSLIKLDEGLTRSIKKLPYPEGKRLSTHPTQITPKLNKDIDNPFKYKVAELLPEPVPGPYARPKPKKFTSLYDIRGAAAKKLQDIKLKIKGSIWDE